MSWVVEGHPEAGEFDGEYPAMAAAWQIADRAGELVRADVIEKVEKKAVEPQQRRGLLDLTSLAADLGPERIAHAIGEKLGELDSPWLRDYFARSVAPETRPVGVSMLMRREEMLGPRFSIERDVWMWLDTKLRADLAVERATVVGELVQSVYERPDQWAVEYRLSGQATKRGGWE